MSDGLDYKFHHGGVSIPDLDEAITWYGSVLGFELEKRFPIPAIPAEVAIVRRGPMRIELFQPVDGQPMSEDRRTPDRDAKTFGNKHIAFAVVDIERTAEELKKRGADIVWVRRNPFGANLFIRDHAGNLIEFLEEKSLFEG